MGNMLDALKNAGLANAKQARKAENAKKQAAHKSLKQGEKREDTAPEPTPTAVRSQAAENLALQLRDRLAQAYKGAEVRETSGRRKFYYTTPDGFIDCIMISDVAAALLDRGKYGIAVSESEDGCVIVRRASALAIEAIDKKRIILLKRQET